MSGIAGEGVRWELGGNGLEGRICASRQAVQDVHLRRLSQGNQSVSCAGRHFGMDGDSPRCIYYFNVQNLSIINLFPGRLEQWLSPVRKHEVDMADKQTDWSGLAWSRTR